MPKGEASKGAIALAERIARNAPVAVRESLSVARRAYDLDDDALFALGLEAQNRVTSTEDFVEGPRAFIEKRAPLWKGLRAVDAEGKSWPSPVLPKEGVLEGIDA